MADLLTRIMLGWRPEGTGVGEVSGEGVVSGDSVVTGNDMVCGEGVVSKAMRFGALATLVFLIKRSIASAPHPHAW
eukprot:CAMPEP_0115555842 /NCGR_PEP_ID=MMETSP0271-20121206/98033_1 /TAXON_ID=71861 /ORGANISM="Scrippsiella trochoidea, Strain CCMP3099" /LENGTH=75 /DNA_ID=CAMNT_0002989643 /DNA_START=812 /DNA_END=1036 /DNA_ORIENTATION=+